MTSAGGSEAMMGATRQRNSVNTLDAMIGRVRDTDSHEMYPAALWTSEYGSQFAPLAEFFLKNQSQDVANSFSVRDVVDESPIEKGSLSSYWGRACRAPGAYKIDRRLEFMDLVGVNDALVFSSMMGFVGAQFAVCGGGSMERRVGSKMTFDPVQMGYAMVKAHNDWCIKVAKRTQRLRPVAAILTNTVKDALDEAARLIGEGVRAVNVQAAQPIEGKAPAHPDNDVFWQFFADRDVPIMLHIGSEKTFLTDHKAWWNAPQFAANTSLPSESSNDPLYFATCHFAAQNYITNLVLGGVFERVPNLRLGIAELTGHWIGPAAENMDMWAEQFSRRLSTVLSKKPSEYVRHNLRVTPFSFEPVDQYIERFPYLEDVYCFSTDYPHFEGGKSPLEVMASKLVRFGPAVLEKFFVSNAEWLMPS